MYHHLASLPQHSVPTRNRAPRHQSHQSIVASAAQRAFLVHAAMDTAHAPTAIPTAPKDPFVWQEFVSHDSVVAVC